MAFNYYNIVNDSNGMIMNQLGLDPDNDPTAVSNNTPAGMSAYIGDVTDKPDTVYYVGSVKTNRPLLSTVATIDKTTLIANGVDTINIGPGLPNPTTILVTVPAASGLTIPTDIIVTDGTFTLNTDTPGEYVILVDVFPYLQQLFKVTAI